MLTNQQDAFGHEIFDYYAAGISCEIVEREDGYIDNSGGARNYFAEFKDWPKIEKQAIRYAKGKVLDIGCGAGRQLLYLKEKGHEVLGIDVSPLALETCRRRGIKNVKLLSITQLNSKIGVFDTIIMFGNNFGLFGNPQRAKWLLKRFYKMTAPDGRIIAETFDPSQTKMKEHLEYQKLNKARGRAGGQIKLRIRYRKFATPWFDYLFVSKKEMHDILDGTGWNVQRFIDSGEAAYIAVIGKIV